jgi:glycosyltransferase involved in cell wall biosynthesis
MLYPSIAGLTSERADIEGVQVRRVPQRFWPNRALAAALDEGPSPDLIHLFHPRNILAAQTTAWARSRRVPTVYTWLGPFHDPYLVDDRERPFDAPPRYERLVWTRSQLARRLLSARGPRQVRDLLRNYRLHWPLKAALPSAAGDSLRGGGDAAHGLDAAADGHPAVDRRGRRTRRAPGAARAARATALAPLRRQLTPRKGYDLALRALPAIVARHPTASLLMVSGINAADRAKAEQLAGELGVARHVHFLGRVEDAALVNLFRACDVYLTPTRYEGLRLTLLEAMACGAPCVASDVPSVNEIVRDGDNGLLARREDPDALADAALRLLADAALRERVREGGLANLPHDLRSRRA